MTLLMHFLHDEPITAHEADLLGFSEFVADLKTAIRYTQTPFIYGVLGDWGTGKTSIHRLLEASFRADQGQADQPLYVVPIWFNAWEYENEANIVYPLLHAIKRAFEAFREQTRASIRSRSSPPSVMWWRPAPLSSAISACAARLNFSPETIIRSGMSKTLTPM